MSQREDSSLGVTPLVTRGAQSAFDIRQETDVISLLRLVHINAIEPEVKNRLRDLVFAYRQTLTDEDGKKVGDAFVPLGVAVTWGEQVRAGGVPKERGTTVQDKLGMGRPTPRFANAVKVIPPVQPKVQAMPLVEADNKSETAAEPVPAPAVSSPAEVQSAPTDASERINEIKRLVNEKIGNPVGLLETHEEIGREYMSALLDAMKKSNGAQGGELHIAMDRLELAFKHVQEIDFGKKVPVQTSSAQQETVPPPAPASNQEEIQDKPQKDVAAAEPKIVPQAQEAAQREQIYVPLSVSSEGRPPERPLRISTISEESNTPPAPLEPQSMPAVPTPKAEPPLVQQEPQSVFMSVAKEKQIQDLLRSSKEKEGLDHKREEEARIEQMDPLFAPDVTNGLNQLLSEWKLFKSSGLLGTGPKGKDHPLYKKLSGLTMAAVIAGRFEGANASVKQSITDYMNGWRYEEGVVHDHGETFENYLRRVVRRILSRKQAK